MKLSRSTRLAAAVAAGALLLAACGDDDQAGSGGSTGGDGGSTTTVSGTLSGDGASSQKAAIDRWIADFQEQNPDAQVAYVGNGSGAGRDKFLAGGLDFAGSDVALKDEELEKSKEVCAGATALNLPLYISPIAVAYNLPGVDELQLSPTTIAKIFKGDITTWNDPAIAADNDGVDLPDTRITAIARQDKSGTTENFTEYLAATAASDWTFKPSGDWPKELAGGELAEKTSGVVAAAKAAEGGITYADASQTGELSVAKIKIGEEYAAPSAEGAAKAVANSPRAEGRPAGDLAIEINRSTTAADEYPLVLVTYSILCPTYKDAAKAELVKAFFTYVASAEGQDGAAEAAGSAPITDELRTEVMAQVDKIAAA